MGPNLNEYQVEGYGEHKPYDSDYHPSAYINPAVHYAFGGDPEKQEQWQKDLEELQEAKLKAEAKAETNRPPQEPEVLARQRKKSAPAKKAAAKKAVKKA